DVSAQDGVDYTGTSGTLTFTAGQQQQSLTIPVAITPNPFEDDTETFKLTLSNQSGNAIINRAVATGTILPAFPVPTVSVTSVTQAEGNPPNTTNFVFTISLSNSPGQTPVRVQWATADGNLPNPTDNAMAADNDYTPTGGTLTFNANTLSRNVTVTVIGDT